MPWKERSAMSLRHEFILLAVQEGTGVRALCRRFGISRKTAYKWLTRYRGEGIAGLRERSRRPRRSPRQSTAAVELAVLGVRLAQPRWGGRKIRARLQAQGAEAVPAASTITAIVRRHGGIDPAVAVQHRPWQRFEHVAPNALWQMDFKGHFPLLSGGRCHPLTVLDDHSRFALAVQACANEQGTTVQATLTLVFRRYGLPQRMLMDNGAPWGSDAAPPHTPLTAWLLRLGVGVSHSRPYHPQTQGKDERFHRSLNAELLTAYQWRDVASCQPRFDHWRDVYNCERPHHALALAVPASRYQPSLRLFPEVLPRIEYDPSDVVRKVQMDGHISAFGHSVLISKAFRGLPVALRPTAADGQWDVYFCHHRITAIDLAGSH